MSKTTIPTGGITDGTIASGDLADDAVTAAKISDAVGLGKIGQVVSATVSSDTEITTNSGTVAGATASITPTATSSKVIVLFHCPMLMDANSNAYAEVRLFRGSTQIMIASDITCYSYNNVTMTDFFSINFLDSPSSTSSLTYQCKFYEHGSSTLKLMDTSGSGGVGTSSMTLMEVLA